MSEAHEIDTTEACAAAIARLAALDRDIGKQQHALDAVVSDLKAKVEAKAEPLRKERAALEAEIEIFCDMHRPALTENHARKFATFTTGTAGWRQCAPKLEVDAARLKKIIAALRRRKLKRMLREKIELDYAAIKKEPDKVKRIPGLKIVPGEESFWIEPVALPLVEQPAQIAAAAE